MPAGGSAQQDNIAGYAEALGTTTSFGYYVTADQKHAVGTEKEDGYTKSIWRYVQATTDDIGPNVVCLWAEATTGQYVTDDWTASIALTTDQYPNIVAGVSRTTITSSYWGWLQKRGLRSGIKKTSGAAGDALLAGDLVKAGQSTTDDGAVIKRATDDTTATVWHLQTLGVNLAAAGSTTNVTGMVMLHII